MNLIRTFPIKGPNQLYNPAHFDPFMSLRYGGFGETTAGPLTSGPHCTQQPVHPPPPVSHHEPSRTNSIFTPPPIPPPPPTQYHHPAPPIHHPHAHHHHSHLPTTSTTTQQHQAPMVGHNQSAIGHYMVSADTFSL